MDTLVQVSEELLVISELMVPVFDIISDQELQALWIVNKQKQVSWIAQLNKFFIWKLLFINLTIA